MPAKRRLIIVANRLPVHRVGSADGARWQSSAGGLVTALSPVLQRCRGAWVGWAGTAGPAPRSFTHDGLRIKPVGLSPTDVEKYYHGLCNRTLWPLYHDAIRTPEFKRDWWWPYMDANARFARAAAATARKGDLVWVHDYHLQLVPKMLRELRPDLRIGFFLHTPFPPEEIFAWLPWRRQILEGLLGADVVGFQTGPGARNFSRAAREFTEAEGTDSRLEFEGREVRVNAFPISIDTGWFEQHAADPAVLKEAQDIRRRIGSHRKILLGVDRLDYTKGIDARMNAFDLLLRQKSVSVDDCVLMQIAVPSRETVGEYAQTRKSIEQTVGRINGNHSIPGRVAVHYFRRGYSRAELIPYYRAADVMLVTPLRDGMNLVAKEYVACRNDLGGALVLSEFTGAAAELKSAYQANPYDLDGVKDAIEAAVTQTEQEGRRRMRVLRRQVLTHDVDKWARSFLGTLAEQPSTTPSGGRGVELVPPTKDDES